MKPDYSPFTFEQFLQLKKIILNNQNILFISSAHNSALFAMYRFIQTLKQECTKSICICEYEPLASRFYLQSTLASRFGTQGLIKFAADSTNSIRVFSDIPPSHTYSILSLCAEPESVIACLACSDKKVVNQKLMENIPVHLAKKAFDWVVIVKDTTIQSHTECTVIFVDIQKM